MTMTSGERRPHELPVDLDNARSVETFAQLLKDRPEARLDEIPSFDDTLPAHSPEGRFVHEIVIPFVRSLSVAVAG